MLRLVLGFRDDEALVLALGVQCTHTELVVHARQQPAHDHGMRSSFIVVPMAEHSSQTWERPSARNRHIKSLRFGRPGLLAGPGPSQRPVGVGLSNDAAQPNSHPSSSKQPFSPKPIVVLELSLLARHHVHREPILSVDDTRLHLIHCATAQAVAT